MTRPSRNAFQSKAAGVAAILAAGLIFVPSPAGALEACVRCDGPFAIYRCQVDHPGLPANASIALICITELAKRNGHATCAISKDTGTTCNGDIVAVAPAPGSPIPQAPPPGLIAPRADEATDPSSKVGDADSQQTTTKEAHEDQPDTGAENKTPETVEELAKQTAKASKKGLDQAGDAVVDAAKKTGETIEKTGGVIGDAAKKTWRCIASLFGNC